MQQISLRANAVMSIQRLIGALFIASSNLPWLGFPSLDSQPFTIIFATLFIFVHYINDNNVRNVPNYILLVCFFCLAGLAYSFAFDESFDLIVIRGTANYLGMPIILLAFYVYFEKYKTPTKLIIAINILYLVVAVAQIFDFNIAISLVASRTTDNRGVTSLAPEPAFFGIYLFFISWIYCLIFRDKLNYGLKILIASNIFAILFLAQSSLGLIFLLLSVTFLMTSKIRPRFILLIAILTLCYYFSNIFMEMNAEKYRIVGFIQNFLGDPVTYFSIDASSNQRLAHIVLPLHAFVNNYLLPGGFHGFYHDVEAVAKHYNDYFYYYYVGDKIMSWIPSLLYEMGVFGLFILTTLIVFSRRNNYVTSREIFFLLILLLSSIPLAFPLVLMVFSIFIHAGSSYDGTKRMLAAMPTSVIPRSSVNAFNARTNVSKF